jgi:anti-sigma regulatory factor (Ser/Thr protein kinase)
MRNGVSAAVVVEDASQIGAARRVAVSIAEAAGFEPSDRSDIGIVATEAASNIVRHAGRGEMLLRPVDGPGLELIALDSGPGMRDVEACLTDGYSSRGSIGGGFGAMRRLAREFSVWSAPDQGTAVVCRFFIHPKSTGNGAGPSVAGLALPHPGETACGDGWVTAMEPEGRALLVVDGLGHGPQAEDAAATAIRLFQEEPRAAPERMLGVLHAGMRSTRGAAVAVAAVDSRRRELRFAGVGNISGHLVTGEKTRSLLSHNGTVGHQMRKAQEFVYPWETGTLLLLHSDGLAGHWKLDRYPGLARQDPALIGAVLYRDHARRRDDVCVVVCRLSGDDITP